MRRALQEFGCLFSLYDGDERSDHLILSPSSRNARAEIERWGRWAWSIGLDERCREGQHEVLVPLLQRSASVQKTGQLNCAWWVAVTVHH